MGLFNIGRGYSSEPRVEHVDLRGDHMKKRTAAAVLLAAVGIAALVWAVNGLLTRQPGWTEVEADSSNEPSCAAEFVFNFNAGADGSSPTTQMKALTGIYTQAASEAEKLFSADVRDDEIHGLSLLNANVNKSVTLAPEVWNMLALLNDCGSREIFLGPIYEQYTTLFFCATDEEAEGLNPYRNEQHRQLLAEMAAFACDPEQISVALEEGNRATLRVSDEYLDYAGKNGMERLVDLYWMKNAFAADYMAERMAAAGFTDGYLTCADGFTRSLGGSDVSISGTLYDRVGKNIYKAAVADFGKVKSVAVFHDFPEGRQNAGFYYQFADGEMITPYVDPSDGLCKNSVSCLSVCSDSLSCAQVMLAAKSAYIADEFHPSQLREELADEGAFVFGRDACLYVSSDRIAVSDLLNDGSIEYSLEILK